MIYLSIYLVLVLVLSSKLFFIFFSVGVSMQITTCPKTSHLTCQPELDRQAVGDAQLFSSLSIQSRRGQRQQLQVCIQKFNVRLDMPPHMDYFYHESRVPSAIGLTREDELEPGVISCMLVGDGAVGKTSMIVSYTSNGYPTEYKQTGFDVFSGK